MLRIGLTGGIASGKTTVRKVFEQAGIPMLDADRLTHELLAPGGGLVEAVAAAFGDARAPDGGVDRAKLGAVVFADPEARKRLERIAHPEIRRRIRAFLDAREAEGARAAGAEAALMVESGSTSMYDRVVVAHCAPEQQVERLLARSALTPGEARARIEAQMPVAAKVAAADDLVDTSGSLDEAREAARRLARELLRLSPSGGS